MNIDFAMIGYGSIVGLSLGMTGSGGSILAVPLLVYGAGLSLPQALVGSLFIVACVAAFGALRQSLGGRVDWRAALLFSATGMVISPLVVTLAHDVDETARLVLFAVLMLVVAGHMAGYGAHCVQGDRKAGALRIGLSGALAGALAGFFGVGGGFIIVPLLIFMFAMPYTKAVGTSLASIALISSAALAGHFAKGVALDWILLANFIAGGVLGMLAGIVAMNKVPERVGKLAFAITTAVLAVFMLIDKLYLHQGGAL